MPIQPTINRTFDYGKQGAQGIDPYNILNRHQNELWKYYEQQEKTLRDYGLSKEAHNRAIGQIQREYDSHKFRFGTIKSQLDTIKQGVASGQIDPINGQKAMMQLVVPQGTVEAMFPRPETQPTPLATGVSPSSREGFVEQFDKIRGGMLGYPEGKKLFRWDTKQVIPEKMVKRYMTERNIANLNDPRNVAKIPGFNQAFIESMSKDERTTEALEKLLDPKTGDPRMIAAFSPDSKLNRGFMKQFGVTKTQPITPFAQSLQKQKPKVSLGTKIGLAGISLSPLAGYYLRKKMSTARQALTNKLPTPKTKAEYDSLPSGAQYVGTDGQLRVKK